jgi:hypothetical protein
MTKPTDATAGPAVPSELHRVITLLLVNLGLSAVLAGLFAIFHNSLLGFQMRRLDLPASADTAAVREGLSAGLWSRAVVVVLIGIVYVFLVRQLRGGRRRAYLRVLIISVVSLAGIAYLATSGQYPSWVLVEQAVQAVVLLGLLWAVTRPAVRAHFAKATSTA